MKCRRVQQFLPDYIGDELSVQKRRQVDQHLTECPGCKAALRTLQEVWDGFAEQPRPHKDERFWTELTKGVMTKIREAGPMPADKKRGFLFPGWKVLLPATAAAITIIMGVIAFRGVLWGPQGRGQWIAQGDQTALVEVAPDFSFGPLATTEDDPWEGEMTLQEVSFVAEALSTSLPPEETVAITEVFTQPYDEEDLYGQLEGLTQEELDALYQLLSSKYPYS